MDALLDGLRRSRDVFRENGGAKRWLQDPVTDKLCVRGAINVALTGEAWFPSRERMGDVRLLEPSTPYQLFKEIDNYLNSVTPKEYRQAVDYNNDPSTTKEDCEKLFDLAVSKRERELLVAV